jgi:uncharacterized protein (TIGR01777 family)
MKVILGGSTGYTGTRLLRFFMGKGWTAVPLTRDSFRMNDDQFIESYVDGSDIIINLAGAPVIKRWTEAYKEEIYQSRISTTRKISQAIIRSDRKPSLFISASAIGIYDSFHEHTENSIYLSDDFLGKVCRDWEAEALAAYPATRVAVLRTGIILGNNGGALQSMETPFRTGLGGTIGNGNQQMSWIHIRDLEEIYMFIIEHPEISGIINAVSPNPVTNQQFTKTFAKVLNQPAILRIPEFVLKMIYGEGAQSIIKGQNVLPEKLLTHGFSFSFPTIEKALLNLYGTVR